MIGIDIGSKFIKVCKVVDNDEQEGNEFSVFSVMKNVDGLEDRERTGVIEELLQKLSIDKEKAFLAVGGKELIDRNIFLPNDGISSKEIIENTVSEFETSMEEEAESMYTAHTVVTDSLGNDSSVICSAAPKDMVDAKINIAGSVKNLSVKGVTMEAFALANAFERMGPGYKDRENIVLINIGCNVSNIVVLKNGGLIYFKDIDFGGKNITKDIAETYNIAELLAEEIKIRKPLKEQISFNMPNVLKRTTSTLIENIFSSIEYCINKQFVMSTDRIVITGGGALTEGLDSFIEKTLGIPTNKWNPIENNKFVGYTDKELGYFMPISLGLAFEKERR